MEIDTSSFSHEFYFKKENKDFFGNKTAFFANINTQSLAQFQRKISDIIAVVTPTTLKKEVPCSSILTQSLVQSITISTC